MGLCMSVRERGGELRGHMIVIRFSTVCNVQESCLQVWGHFRAGMELRKKGKG